MNKKDFQKAWNKLDKALEAIEALESNGFIEDEGVLFSDIATLKEKVEIEIDKRTRK